MGTIDKIIDAVIEREGGAKATNDPNDPGGRTQYGISEKSNPEAWKDGKVTSEEAREIYRRKYVEFPGFHRIPDSHARVREQLIDFGVHSGPGVAIQNLQEVLGIKVDGQFGPKSLAALVAADPRSVNNKLVVERLKLVGRVVQKNPKQLDKLVGFINRACEFLV